MGGFVVGSPEERDDHRDISIANTSFNGHVVALTVLFVGVVSWLALPCIVHGLTH